MDDIGLEPKSVTTCSNNGLPHPQNEGGAESGAVAPPRDSDLDRIIRSWPRLTLEVRKAILDLIDDGIQRTEADNEDRH